MPTLSVPSTSEPILPSTSIPLATILELASEPMVVDSNPSHKTIHNQHAHQCHTKYQAKAKDKSCCLSSQPPTYFQPLPSFVQTIGESLEE